MLMRYEPERLKSNWGRKSKPNYFDLKTAGTNAITIVVPLFTPGLTTTTQ